MPTYEVEVNGSRYQIDAPDDASATKALQGLQSQAPEKGFSIDRFESNLNSSASGFANGVPFVGPYLNEGLNKAEAGIRSLWNGDSYQNELDSVHARENADIAANPVTHTLGQVGGAVTAMTPVAMAAPVAFGGGSAPLLTRMAYSGVTGGGIGATDMAIRSNLDPKQTAIGGLIGLGAGALGPAIGKAVGAGVRYFTEPNDAVSALSSAARNYVTQELSDPIKLAAQQADLARLGPQATLADVSPEWLGVARGAASRPGTRDAIVQPLLDRQAAANARLGADLDASLGPAIIPSQIDTTLAANQDLIRPLYREAFANAQPFNTRPIAQALTQDITRLRGPAQAALGRVRQMLNIVGDDQLSTDPRVMFEARQAIDGMLNGETNTKVISALSDARQMIDDGLRQAVPGIKDADAAFAELARQREALQLGRPILNNGATALRPQEVDQLLRQGALPQGQQIGPSGVPTRMQQSVRAEIDRATGTNAVDTTAVRNIVRGEGDWNRQKLGSLFGLGNADRALNAIDRENIFGQTANRVAAGSDTAMASRFGDFLDAVGKPTDIPGDLTTMGVAARSTKKVINALLEQNGEAKAAQFANELGRLSIATGTPRDQIIQALIARAQQPVSAVDPATQALISAVLQGGGRQALR